MNVLKSLVLLAFTIVVSSALANAANVQVGDVVFAQPGSESSCLKVGSEVVAKVEALIYLRVLEVNGQWLAVEGRDVFTTDAVTPRGWILISEVVSFDEYIDFLDKYMVQKKPNDAAVYSLTGLFCRLSKRPDSLKRAISYYSRAIQLDPADESHYARRALTWSELAGWEMAVADVRQALVLDPANEAYRNALTCFQAELEREERLLQMTPSRQQLEEAAGEGEYLVPAA